MLWKSAILTVIICGLFVLGASTIIIESQDINDTIEPVGIIAESTNDPAADFTGKYREWIDMRSGEDDSQADVDENAGH
jgi:hypothetical protein